MADPPAGSTDERAGLRWGQGRGRFCRVHFTLDANCARCAIFVLLAGPPSKKQPAGEPTARLETRTLFRVSVRAPGRRFCVQGWAQYLAARSANQTPCCRQACAQLAERFLPCCAQALRRCAAEPCCAQAQQERAFHSAEGWSGALLRDAARLACSVRGQATSFGLAGDSARCMPANQGMLLIERGRVTPRCGRRRGRCPVPGRTVAAIAFCREAIERACYRRHGGSDDSRLVEREYRFNPRHQSQWRRPQHTACAHCFSGRARRAGRAPGDRGQARRHGRKQAGRRDRWRAQRARR
jgi:hypothetical protein